MRRALVFVVWLGLGLGVCGCGYPEFDFRATDAADDSRFDGEDAADDTLDASSPADVAPDAPDAHDAPDAQIDTGEPACTPSCEPGVACAAGACRPLASCAAIKARWPSLPSGAYTIDPDGDGGSDPFRVFCEQVDDGGGWTLAMKLDGAKKTFAYDSAYWTNEATLNEASTDLSETEAKLASFHAMPITAVRLGMLDGGVRRYMSFALARPSLESAFVGGVIATTATRGKWFQLLADPALQLHCNAEGFNQEYGGTVGARPRVRLGIVGNNETDCTTPDSYLGFGAELGNPASCYGGADPGVVVGNVAPATCGSAVPKSTTNFGYVFVR